MRPALRALAATVALLLAAPAAAAACPRRDVPSPPPAPASADAVVAYLTRLDAASDRVRAASLGRSAEGREMPYALVGAPRRIAPGAVSRLSRRLRAAREGGRPAAVRGAPAVVWLAAGVHGNERSGVDADLRVLADLAAGSDCAVLRATLTVVVPMQNPDGMEAGSRTNANGFDLNRDWFAATQPETAPKLRLLRELPPVAFADQHEQDGTRFFFPPNAEPVNADVPRHALRAIDRVIAPALRRAFDRAGLAHASGEPFDLFFMGYGDSVTSTLFGAAGMTFEMGGAAPYAQRVAEHELAARALLRRVASRRASLVRRWARSWPAARRAAARAPVRAYVLRPSADASALAERLRVVGVRVSVLQAYADARGFVPYGARRARSTRLGAGTLVVETAQPQFRWIDAMLAPRARPSGRGDVTAWSNPLLAGLRAGWLRQPLVGAQVERAWSAEPASAGAGAGAGGAFRFRGDSVGALATAVDALRSGATVDRGDAEIEVTGVDAAFLARAAKRMVVVRPVPPQPALRRTPLREPRAALLADLQPPVLGRAGHEDSALHESHGWTRWALRDRLGVDLAVVTPAELEAGALDGRTALVVADGVIPPGELGAGALAAIGAFVQGGGTYVGVRSLGLQVARSAGITDVRERSGVSLARSAGAIHAVAIDDRDPLGWDLGETGFQLNVGDPVFDPGSATSVVRYPDPPSFASGVARPAALAGTPALLSGVHGAGRVALFASDPSFRGYSDGSLRLLANALLAPPPAP